MKKIKAKASSLPIFNGRISDSSTSSTSSASIRMMPTKLKNRTTFNGAIPPTVFAISSSSSSVASLMRDDFGSEEPKPLPVQVMEQVELLSKSTTQQAVEPLNIIGAELRNYEKVEVVGQGSFGVAILYRRKSDNHHIVFKQINLTDLTPPERDLAMNEVEVFSKLHHPNIISYLGSFIKDNTLLIEMEYADDGTLAQIIASRSPEDYFPERYVIAIFEQISSALKYMHSENILHRDLKTANVFLNKRGIVKIGDFGISKIMNTKIHAQTVLGTPYYFSPEMCEGKEYDHKSDIWALGCILGEMCCLKKSFGASNLSELVTKIMAGAYAQPPSGYSSGLRSLLSSLLQVEASRRPKASDILDYWIPLIFRNLGKHRGYSYSDNINSTTTTIASGGDLMLTRQDETVRSIISTSGVELPTAKTETKAIMKNETVPPIEIIHKRSVLYQLKSFGNEFSMDPIQLPPKACIVTVATSELHFVVVTDDGSVYTWGEYSQDQLGLSSLDAWKHYPTRMESVRSRHIVGACAGYGFTILLTQAGTLLSCGDNSKFALGHGDSRMYHSPTLIGKLEYIKIQQIEAGTDHVLALSADGSVYGWGTSVHGALGLGNLQTQQRTPRKIVLFNLSSKVEKVFCGPDASAILCRNGDVYVCGSNNYNKLGVHEPGEIMEFKKIVLPRKVVDLDLSASHSVFLLEGGYVLTMGRNSEGQCGVGHCNVSSSPTLVESIKERYIVRVKCNDQCTVVSSDDNIITFWGTRNGILDSGETNDINHTSADSSKYPDEELDLEIGNNTAALTNFLASVYKSEVILEPVDLVALYSSKEQCDKGYHVTVNNIYPLPHSVLVLVDTTAPLNSSLEELG